MFQPSLSISQPAPPYAGESISPRDRTCLGVPARNSNVLLDGIQRRWRRERRRRKVGRAYDMALEIARVVPANSRVLDVGCGTGCLAILLAESGRTVMGADPARASLEVAKASGQSRRVRIDFPPEARAAMKDIIGLKF